MLARLCLGAIAVACFLNSPIGSADEQPFLVNTTAKAPHYIEDGSGFINLLVAEIFGRLEMEYQLIWLPAERSLVFTNDGTVDGIVPRATAIEAKYTNLIRVPVEVFEFDFQAYVRDPAIKIEDWSSLESYTVGMINGWKIVEQNAGDARLLLKVNNYEQLFNLLEKERVDVAILDRVMGGWVLKKLGLDLVAVEPPLSSVPTYFYVHKKHRKLVPEIARVLSQMKQDGSYDEIRRRSLSGFILP